MFEFAATGCRVQRIRTLKTRLSPVYCVKMFVAAGFDEIENHDGSYSMTKPVANMLEKACWPSCRHDVDENE